MKKIFLSLLIIAFTGSINAQIKTPAPSPSSKIEQMVGLTDVTLEYSRPGIKNRIIFGDLVPFGEIWRTGANENTKITFSTDVIIDGQTLKKGSYSIYTIPNKENWDVMFYSDATNWGIPEKWDETKVVAKTTVQVQPIPMKIETFTMTFDDLTNNSTILGMLWENVYAGVKIEVPTKKVVNASIDKVMAGPESRDYYSAAVYYLQEGKDINKAKTWINKAVNMSKDEPRFWYLRQQSLILAKAGDKKGAITAAKASLKEAKTKGNTDYVRMNEEFLKKMM